MADDGSLQGAEGKGRRSIFWAIIAIGIALPWVVGIAVKLYLDAHGKPTLPWSDFLSIRTLPFLIPLSIWFAIPYIALAYCARKLLSRPFAGLTTYKARLVFLLGGLLGGCVGTVLTFIGVFWEFDPLFFLVPLWIDYVPHMAAGLFLGFLVAKALEAFLLKGP